MRDKQKNPSIAIALSFIPGLSHLYLKKIKKAVVLFVIDIGLLLIFIFAKSYLMKLIMVNIYLFTFLPACLETYNLAKGKQSRISTDSRWYVTVLLITTGFNAVPLLWQSDQLTKRFKLIWTILVPVLALVYLLILVKYWEQIETFVENVF